MKYIYTFILFLIPNILYADEYKELEQRFNRNVSQHMLSVFGESIHKDMNAKGKSDHEANVIVQDFLDGMSRCLMYSLVSLPKDVGEQMYKDISDGMDMQVAKVAAEKRWLTLIKDGKFTKEQVYERVKRSDAVRVVCNKNLKISLGSKYHLSNWR